MEIGKEVAECGAVGTLPLSRSSICKRKIQQGISNGLCTCFRNPKQISRRIEVKTIRSSIM
jgi:hypothetical protein